EIEADGVVLATEVSALKRIDGNSDDLSEPGWRSGIAAMRGAAPFVVHRLWLDRPTRSDRPACLGTGGPPAMDNVSVLDRYEREARAWAGERGGSVVELHAYSVADGHADVRDRLLARLHDLYPETRTANIVAERVLCRDD